jgi:hypothetical protein
VTKIIDQATVCSIGSSFGPLRTSQSSLSKSWPYSYDARDLRNYEPYVYLKEQVFQPKTKREHEDEHYYSLCIGTVWVNERGGSQSFLY